MWSLTDNCACFMMIHHTNEKEEKLKRRSWMPTCWKVTPPHRYFSFRCLHPVLRNVVCSYYRVCWSIESQTHLFFTFVKAFSCLFVKRPYFASTMLSLYTYNVCARHAPPLMFAECWMRTLQEFCMSFCVIVFFDHLSFLRCLHWWW